MILFILYFRFSGFYWLLSKEPTAESQQHCNAFSNIVGNCRNQQGEINKEELKAKFQVNQEEIVLIAEATIGQSDVALWHLLRIGRLTASNFGVVLAACRRNRYSSF